MSQLITLGFQADLPTTCEWLTRLGLADCLVQVLPTRDLTCQPSRTEFILRVSDDLAPPVRAMLGWSSPGNLPLFNLNIDKRWVPPST